MITSSFSDIFFFWGGGVGGGETLNTKMLSDKYRVILCSNKARCVINKSLRHFLRNQTLNWFSVSGTVFSSFWATLYGSKKSSVICFVFFF